MQDSDDPEEIICGEMDRGDAGERVVNALRKHGYEIIKTPEPSREAMEAAVSLEIEACIGRVKTIRIGQIVQRAIDSASAVKAGDAG